MAGIEGMKDGSQAGRDRLVISLSTELTLLSVSLSEVLPHTIVCCRYLNRKEVAHTSLDASPPDT